MTDRTPMPRRTCDVLTLPSACSKRVRNARLDYANPPANVALHPIHARNRAPAELPPPVTCGTVEGAVLLALIATLDAHQRASGAPTLMLDMLRNTHRFSTPEAERPACALVGNLWDQLAIAEHERRFREGHAKGSDQ